MDVSRWGLGRIMQLPDHCFGRRWPVGVYASTGGTGTYYDISEAGLGDRCVVWQASYWTGGEATARLLVSLSLGDVLPVTDAEFDALEPVFSDLGRIRLARRGIDLAGVGVFVSFLMRLPVMAQGRRLVGRFEVLASALAPPAAVLTVSSIPREVPDCLLSV